jgi:hypothetical protein
MLMGFIHLRISEKFLWIADWQLLVSVRRTEAQGYRAMPPLSHRITVRLTGASNTVMESHSTMHHVHIFCSSRQHTSRAILLA